MALDVSRIVAVDISASPLALARAGFGILNIVGITNRIPLTERIRAYDNITGVAVDFETTDEEYLAAAAFFSQSPRPTPCYISRRISIDSGAVLFGSTTDVDETIATWASISDGAFDITLAAGLEQVIAVDTSAATTMTDVATAITAQMATSVCTWDGTRLLISEGTDSADTLTFTVTATGAGTNISAMMGTETTDTGAYVDQGADSETITASLDAIEALNSKWYGYAFTSEVRDGSITDAGTNKDSIDAAAWAETRTKIFANASSDTTGVLSAVSTTDIAYELSALGYKRTFTAYNEGDYFAVSMFARGATVDFDGTNTTITYKFKQAPGIVVSDLSATQANTLITKNCNYYASFGTQLSGDARPMIAEGVVASGVFLDEVVGIDWLTNAIQTDVFNYLYQSSTKIPQTDQGVAGIQQAIEKVLDRAVNNGLAAPGTVTIDGSDIFLDKGYLVITTSVNDQSQASRDAREAPPIAFIIKGAGAIHSVTITGTFVR